MGKNTETPFGDAGHKIINAPPRAARSIGALSSLGYDFNSAVADIIDNSIDAGAKNIFITLRREDEKAQFQIRDDGKGMSLEKLREAMHLGSRETYDEDKLGKFGMGLKTASLSQCRRFLVASNAAHGLAGLNGFGWDKSHVENSDQWGLVVLSRAFLSGDKRLKDIWKKPGTVVVWEELTALDKELAAYERDGNAQNKFLGILTRFNLHIRMTFHRFLDGSLGPRKKVQIYVNGTKLTPWDPFARSENHPRTFKAVHFIPEGETKKCEIRVQPYILPDQSAFSTPKAWEAARGLLPLNDAQGLYVYRRNRIIHFGGWLHIRGKNPHAAYARSAVDFPEACDHLFDVDVRKRNLRLPASIFDEIKSATAESVGAAIKLASKSVSKNAGVHRKTAYPAGKAVAKTMGRFGVTINDPNHGKVRVTNRFGSFDVPLDGVKYEELLETPVIPGKIEDGALWKVIPRKGNRVSVVLNTEHPFYLAVYDGSNSRLHKSMDAVLLAIAITQVCAGTEQNLRVFTEARSLISAFLADIAKADGFLGKGNSGPRGRR